MRYCEVRQVFCAEREVFGGPAAQEDALGPGLVRIGWDGADGGGNEAHDGFGVIVELLWV